MSKLVTRPLSPSGTVGSRSPMEPGFRALADFATANDLEPGGAHLAWEIASMAPGLGAADRDAVAMLVGRLLVAQANGDTRLSTTLAERSLLGRARDIVAAPPTRAPLVLDDEHLYTQRSHACETRVAQALSARIDRRPSFSSAEVEQALAEVAEGSDPRPSSEQLAAIARALERSLGVISGGPGTGKTTSALALVRALARVGVAPERIALAAPTGKAASRLEDNLRARLAALADAAPADRDLLERCPPAQTLHRLLGAGHGSSGLARAGGDRLPFHAVIVDESSMIDLLLMDRLLAALSPDALLVLLGDADQLPSVSAGAVFRDLDPVAIRLQRGFRVNAAQPAGERIVKLAQAISVGDARAALAQVAERPRAQALEWRGIEHLGPEEREQVLLDHQRALMEDDEVTALSAHVFAVDEHGVGQEDGQRLDALAARLASTRVLAVTRQGPAGAQTVNAFLHAARGDGQLFPGEPMMMLRNDYGRELWNGDQGVAVRVRAPGKPAAVMVAFRSRKGWIILDPRSPRSLGSELDFAYALTVHKAQGSEFDRVLLLLPERACPLLTRELLYTALSRARQGVVICGDLEALRSGVLRAENRGGGVGERLQALRLASRTT